MNATIFLANTGQGLARATRDNNDNWSVEVKTQHQDVRCLAVDPLDQQVIYAGTRITGCSVRMTRV
jgi:hypothetical protein